ncbi:hypothetical protein BDV95DRAFT_376757 [Massariosphaeria phaeospora]|uniref:Uncharacterized protein n=1 Tax=Massariosphaeria phaeospora TaxID=100035 RepID=A0A7C8MAH5_9PLEO|nr:hypothetical protein BDV95DRAFT_376757 [Massariosphaeria phaeospora]
MEVPQEIYDAIVFHVENCQYNDSGCAARSTEIYSEKARKRLSVLRLVNQGFCRSASIRLFRTIRVVCSIDSMSRDPNHSAPKSLFELSKSRYCLDVRKVVVCIIGGHFVGLMDPDAPGLRQFMQDLAAVLPECLADFRRLSSFTFSVRPRLKGEPCHETLREQFAAIMANTFRYVPFGGLEELELNLPLTQDFAALLNEGRSTPDRFSIRSALRTVKHLALTVSDSTGFGGRPYDTMEPSAGQAEFPNNKYACDFFEWVGLATNLESLDLFCTHVLDMDVLDLTNLNKLRVLDICRIKISLSRLQFLVEQNRTSLRVIWLGSVELKTGTWTDALIGLCHLPHLEYFYAGSVGYSSDGESAHWRSSGYDFRPIASIHGPDHRALKKLERQVVATRRAHQLPELQPSDDGMYAFDSPVEDILPGDE